MAKRRNKPEKSAPPSRWQIWALLLLVCLLNSCCSSLFRDSAPRRRLVAAVTVDLDDPSWTSKLDARAAAAGLEAVLCAIDGVLAQLAAPPAAAPVPTVNLGELHSAAAAERRRARAEAWRAVHRR